MAEPAIDGRRRRCANRFLPWSFSEGPVQRRRLDSVRPDGLRLLGDIAMGDARYAAMGAWHVFSQAVRPAQHLTGDDRLFVTSTSLTSQQLRSMLERLRKEMYADPVARPLWDEEDLSRLAVVADELPILEWTPGRLLDDTWVRVPRMTIFDGAGDSWTSRDPHPEIFSDDCWVDAAWVTDVLVDDARFPVRKAISHLLSAHGDRRKSAVRYRAELRGNLIYFDSRRRLARLKRRDTPRKTPTARAGCRGGVPHPAHGPRPRQRTIRQRAIRSGLP